LWLYNRGVNEAFFAELSEWLTQAGLAGTSETDILSGCCGRCVAAGLPLARAHMFVDTLHPVHEGRLFRWGYGDSPLLEYGRTSPDALAASGRAPRDVEAARVWRDSPHYKMMQTGDSFLRRRLNATAKDEFPVLADFVAAGMTDYVAIISRFAPEGVIGEMDGVYSSWATSVPDGFSDGQVAALERIAPYLALAIKSVSLARMTATLMETYLGRERRPARARRTHRARNCRAHRRGRLVQRFARLHAHHRHRAGTRDSLTQRLLRCNRLGHSRAWR
jgi:adenylate cyclase